MKTGLIQMPIIEGNVKSNIECGLKLLNRAIAMKLDLIIFPELWTTGYALEDLRTLAVSEEHNKIVPLLQGLALRHKLHILAGTMPYYMNGNLFNRALFISSSGKILATYDKIHLVPMFNEDLYFTAGNHICSFILDGITCGILVCYDLRFPEQARVLTIKRGCKILFIPSEWPASRGEHWLTLNKARAIENQLFICATNRVGTNGKIDFFGHSLIIDPNGTIIAEGPPNEESIVIADIDFHLVEEVRNNIPALKNRRDDVYE
jgi:predicted amidohydrolase